MSESKFMISSYSSGYTFLPSHPGWCYGGKCCWEMDVLPSTRNSQVSHCISTNSGDLFSPHGSSVYCLTLFPLTSFSSLFWEIMIWECENKEKITLYMQSFIIFHWYFPAWTIQKSQEFVCGMYVQGKESLTQAVWLKNSLP